MRFRPVRRSPRGRPSCTCRRRRSRASARSAAPPPPPPDVYEGERDARIAQAVDRLPRVVRGGRPPRRTGRELAGARRDGHQALRVRDLGGDPARARRPDQGDRPRERLLPLLVPASVLAAEGDLGEGFAPQGAVVTEAGGKPLEEPLAVRPTSEAMIWATYGRWMQSYRDLPLRYNQWANAVRWGPRPRR